MSKLDLSNYRKNYQLGQFDINDCSNSPFEQFKKWIGDAIDAQLYEPNGMQLATVDSSGQPSIRTVLLKEFSDEGFVFFTNYNSKKAQELSQNNKAGLIFWWREHERQVRIEGIVHKIDKEASKEYFYARPKESQIGAISSPQSQVIPNREYLDNRYQEFAQQFKESEVPFPDNWGGFILVPNLFEFWQGRESRLHDRIEYIFENDNWTKQRLAP